MTYLKLLEIILKCYVSDGPKVALRVANQPVNEQTVIINENSRINMTCVVDANPPIIGSIEWILNSGNIVHYGAYYVIDEIYRTQAGNYTCRARNELTPSGGSTLPKESRQSLRLVVHCEYQYLVIHIFLRSPTAFSDPSYSPYLP